MDILTYLRSVALLWVVVLFSVYGERQRADIEIPVLPYADYQFDGPITEPSILSPTTATTEKPSTLKKTPPETTTSSTTITQSSTQSEVEKPTSKTTAQPAETQTSTTSTKTTIPDKSEGDKDEEILSDKVTYYPHNPPNDQPAAAIKPSTIQKADTKPSIQAVDKEPENPSKPDEMSYIIAGSVAGGVALIGGVAMTIGILASQGKLGSPSGFSPVSTNV